MAPHACDFGKGRLQKWLMMINDKDNRSTINDVKPQRRSYRTPETFDKDKQCVHASTHGLWCKVKKVLIKKKNWWNEEKLIIIFFFTNAFEWSVRVLKRWIMRTHSFTPGLHFCSPHPVPAPLFPALPTQEIDPFIPPYSPSPSTARTSSLSRSPHHHQHSPQPSFSLSPGRVSLLHWYPITS